MTVAQLGQHEGTSAVIDEPHQFKTKENSSSQTRGNQEHSIVQQPPKQGSLEDTGTPSAMVSTDGTGNLKAQKNLRMSRAITITATTPNRDHSPRTSRTVRRSNHVTVDSGSRSTVSTFETAEVRAAIVHGLANAWNKFSTKEGTTPAAEIAARSFFSKNAEAPSVLNSEYSSVSSNFRSLILWHPSCHRQALRNAEQRTHLEQVILSVQYAMTRKPERKLLAASFKRTSLNLDIHGDSV
jgi:hypothetical protein